MTKEKNVSEYSDSYKKDIEDIINKLVDDFQNELKFLLRLIE